MKRARYDSFCLHRVRRRCWNVRRCAAEKVKRSEYTKMWKRTNKRWSNKRKKNKFCEWKGREWKATCQFDRSLHCSSSHRLELAIMRPATLCKRREIEEEEEEDNQGALCVHSSVGVRVVSNAAIDRLTEYRLFDNSVTKSSDCSAESSQLPLYRSDLAGLAWLTVQTCNLIARQSRFHPPFSFLLFIPFHSFSPFFSSPLLFCSFIYWMRKKLK